MGLAEATEGWEQCSSGMDRGGGNENQAV